MSRARRPELDVAAARRAERRVALSVLASLLTVVALAVMRQLWWI